MKRADFYVNNHGTITTFLPASRKAAAWWAREVSSDTLVYAGAFVVEHRYAGPIIEGIADAGLKVA